MWKVWFKCFFSHWNLVVYFLTVLCSTFMVDILSPLSFLYTSQVRIIKKYDCKYNNNCISWFSEAQHNRFSILLAFSLCFTFMRIWIAFLELRMLFEKFHLNMPLTKKLFIFGTCYLYHWFLILYSSLSTYFYKITIIR